MIETPHKIDVLKAGVLDTWGEPTIASTKEMNGNLRTQTKVVTNSNGKEVVSNYTILFIGFVDLVSVDKFRFTEPNGEVVESAPIQLKFMRQYDGSVAMTKVVL